MSISSGYDSDDRLRELVGRAENVWGAERVEALRPALENAAKALERLSHAPLELLEYEPDFVDGAPPAGVQ